MKVFLVEDEWMHAEDIRISIENLQYQWLGYAVEGFDAIKKIKELEPDVVLLDMTLHGALSGIAIAEHITKEFNKPFIFITSHTEDAVIEMGLQVNPVAYLTKPVNEGDLKAALIKAKSISLNNTTAFEISDTAGQLLIRIGKNLKPVHKNDIAYIETGEKNYSKIHSSAKEQYTVKKSLTALFELLDPKQFYRVHREYIINLGAVTKIDETEQTIYLGEYTVPIGNSYKQGFLKRFNVL
jgi:DNA-binding LytR/AlgR family response regulator